MPLSPSPSSPPPCSDLDAHIAAIAATIAAIDDALDTARICLADLHMQNLKLARARREQVARSNDEIIATFTPVHFRVVRPEMQR